LSYITQHSVTEELLGCALRNQSSTDRVREKVLRPHESHLQAACRKRSAFKARALRSQRINALVQSHRKFICAIGDPISRKRLEKRGRATRTRTLEKRNIAGRRSLRRRGSSGNEVTHIRIRIQGSSSRGGRAIVFETFDSGSPKFIKMLMREREKRISLAASSDRREPSRRGKGVGTGRREGRN